MSAIAGLALSAGLPIVEAILSRRLGDANGRLAGDLIRAVAGRVGVEPDQVEAMATENPGRVIDALREAERVSPEMLAAYDRELQLQIAALEADQDEPTWVRVWRPGGMYLIGFLWLWQIVILHVANAIFKIALPAAPFDVLMGLSGLYFTLYMGGHTVKDVVGKWVAK